MRVTVEPGSAAAAGGSPTGQGGRGPEVPACHHVGERVVVDPLVVLVRPYHLVDVGTSGGVHPAPGRPVPCCLRQQLRQLPRRAAGPPRVMRGRPGDIGGDVLLKRTGEDRDHLATEPAAGGVTSSPPAADSQGKRAPLIGSYLTPLPGFTEAPWFRRVLPPEAGRP
jgi:hypothetical protein